MSKVHIKNLYCYYQGSLSDLVSICLPGQKCMWFFEVLWILTDSKQSEEQAPALHKHIDLGNSFVYFGSSFSDLKNSLPADVGTCELIETWWLHWITGKHSVWMQKKATVCQFAIPHKRQWLLLSLFFNQKWQNTLCWLKNAISWWVLSHFFAKGPWMQIFTKWKMLAVNNENWFCDRFVENTAPSKMAPKVSISFQTKAVSLSVILKVF